MLNQICLPYKLPCVIAVDKDRTFGIFPKSGSFETFFYGQEAGKKAKKEIDSCQLWRFPKGRLATKLLLNYS